MVFCSPHVPLHDALFVEVWLLRQTETEMFGQNGIRQPDAIVGAEEGASFFVHLPSVYAEDDGLAVPTTDTRRGLRIWGEVDLAAATRIEVAIDGISVGSCQRLN